MKIPAKFTSMVEAFGAAARDCESSGSEHSADLFGESFLEREIWGNDEEAEEIDRWDEDMSDLGILSEEFRWEFDALFRKLFDREIGSIERKIHGEVEKSLREIAAAGDGELPSSSFKRRLMARLRGRGLDAGICKSKWEKRGNCSPGSYEFVDVISGGSRYIVEVFLAGEFTIARPTPGYASLLENFPEIFVGKPEGLKQLVSKMCSAMRASMKAAGISVPPWRRVAYMNNRWFGTYRRTTNDISGRQMSAPRGESPGNQMTGFLPGNGISIHCRPENGGGVDLKRERRRFVL
ncbi:hypothetical protein M569_17134 [Genlisea aurea]|uniref:DUF506 family protein n=1 Tax=Genlisea aurea TaxID=192259 RepID=S8D4S0_9LAMI|nr:hypothetical protein M569_17134 [Genlisea aurea]